MTSLGLVFGGCFGLAICMEGLSYLLGARRPYVQNLDKKLKEATEVLEKEQAKAKKDPKLIENMTKNVTERQKALSQALIWSQLAPTVLSLIMIPPILRQLKGQVVGYVPFNIPWPLTMVLQSGLESPAPTAVSMNFFYFVTIAICRSFVKRFYPQIATPSPF